MPRMAKTEQSIRVGQAIREARKARGLVMREIAAHNETDVAAVGNWETGRNLPKTENLIKTAEYLRVDPTALARGEVVYLDDEPTGDAQIISDFTPAPSGPLDVEKLGVVAAGDDGDFSFNGEVADYVRRPSGLKGRPGVFALELISDSMYPRFEKRDIIFCDRLPPEIGDDVVIETFPEPGAKIGKAFVKRLRKRTASALIVEQFNPPKEITFNPYAIKHVWRVVPNRELHGH